MYNFYLFWMKFILIIFFLYGFLSEKMLFLKIPYILICIISTFRVKNVITIYIHTVSY